MFSWLDILFLLSVDDHDDDDYDHDDDDYDHDDDDDTRVWSQDITIRLD